MTDDDDNAKIGIWVALGVVGLLLLSLVGALAWNAIDEAPATKPAVAAAMPDANDMMDLPLTGDLLGKAFFEVGKADVSPEALNTVESVINLINAAPSRKVVLSGFHDLSGDPAQNAELAKQRAKAIREALKAKGLAAERILLRKPAETGVGGPAEEARRVEIRLVEMP
jgi:outer membrane protein OmpA-like peptidoglycan-associated protein